ncbi:class I adenylate-forming enzyme family protein [uncultured Jatrophihabitans sp.]|uniref:class I adenylate-forming enzyme family protein n=1 Tax=uncultured Jatrophihabitans sp. TaxID=1610747 RepID=UPI0035CC2A3D
MGVSARTLEQARARNRLEWYRLGLYQRDDLGTVIARGLRAAPGTELTFAHGGTRQTLTFGELDLRSAAVAAGFVHAGLRPGDRVLVQLPSSVELVVTMVAALRTGIVIVPLPTAAGEQHLEAALADSGARLLVVPDEWRGVTHQTRLAAAAAVPALTTVLVTGPGAPADLAFDRLPGADAGAYVPRPLDPDAPCALIYTSGSSGRPKGVLHSHNALLTEVSTGWAGLSGEDVRRTFVPLPPGHVGGLVSTLIPLVTRRAAGFLEPWDRDGALALIRDVGATVMGSVPFFLAALLDGAGPGDLAPLAFSSQGGAGVPAVLVERADAVGVLVARSYGLTEHPTVTAGSADDPFEVRAHTDGRVTPGNRVRIVDDVGRDVPRGAVGEIVTLGPELMVGYTDPEQDLAAHLPGGWFRTGDLGRIDTGTAALVVTGRLKEIIIRGGENIAAADVEQVLFRHPDVADAAVVGVPDARYGERVLAVVVPRDGAAVDLTAIRSHFAAAGAGRLLTPELLRVVVELPRGATGKVLRRRLQQDWQGRGG